MSKEETGEASGSVWLSRDVEQPGGLSQRHTWSAHRRHSTHASPRSQSSLEVLLWAASVTRTVARMLMPSQAVDDPRPQPRRCTNALGRWLSRPRLMARLEEAGVSTAGQRGYHILWLAQSAVICLGPMEGKRQTFALLDEWVPAPRKLPRAEALAELALRYFISHGPATIHDFAWWAGLTVTDARAALRGGQTRLARTA